MDKKAIEGFLTGLGIKELFDSSSKEDEYTIDLVDSDSYSRVYTILDKSDKVDLDAYSTTMDENGTSLTYLGDDWDLTLSANFEDNSYVLTVREAGE